MLNLLLPLFSGSVPQTVVIPPNVATITLAPTNPGNLGLAPASWTTHVTTTGGLTQVKWMVGINGAKTIEFARTSNLVSVPSYNHGDVINFTGYGTGFTLTKDSAGTNRFLASGSSGSTSFNIGTETSVAAVRFTENGGGGTGTLTYTIVNLVNNQIDIQATFNRAGDSLIVKSIDETVSAVTTGVTFGGVGTKSITITPHNPGDLVTAPANWTTRVNAVGLDQVQWTVRHVSTPTVPSTGSGLVRGRPVFQNNSIRSDTGSLLRGVTFALDGPGEIATNYSNTRSNWQKFRDLKFNLVRMPFALSYYGIALSTQLPYMDAMVAHAGATGMYVMFMYDNNYGVKAFDECFSVWPTICDRYKNNTNVLFEMGNEWVWGADEWSTSELNQVGDLYTAMHNAAPNSFIGCLMLSSMENTNAAVSAMNTVRNRAGAANFNKAFIATHAYGPDSDPAGHAQTIKNSYPIMMTETTYTGSDGQDDPVNKMPQLDSVGCAWIVLNPRFGEVSDPSSPFGDAEDSLTDRIIPEWHSNGFDWTQDALSNTGGGNPTPTPTETFAVVNLVNQTTQLTANFTTVGDTLVVKSIDGTVQDISGAVSFSGVVIPTDPGPQPGGQTLSMNPLNPGDLGTPPKTWETVVTATGMSSFEWVVRGPSDPSAFNWAVANLVNGKVTLRPTFTEAGQYLAISTPDNSVRQISGLVSFGGGVVTPPGGGGGGGVPTTSDYVFANNFVKDLTMGVNLERGTSWGASAAYFNKLKNDGSLTHIKIYVPTRPEWGTYVDENGLNGLADTIQTIISTGMKVILGCCDVLSFDALNTQEMKDYVDLVARVMAARNIDPRYFCIGPWGEMAEWDTLSRVFDNGPINPLRRYYQDLLRGHFPNHIIVSAGTSWSAFEGMIDPSFEVYEDKRTIYEWHSYQYYGREIGPWADAQSQIMDWKTAHGVVTFGGEVAEAGETGGLEQGNLPPMITSVSRGIWRERPMIWAVTGGGYFRLNNESNYDLEPNIAAAFREANTYIRSQPDFGT